MAKHVGFSGTQRGMTSAQIYAVDRLLEEDIITQIAHHGDCIGADADFHNLSVLEGLVLIGHPPINESKRAFCIFDEVREPKEYIERNHDIVDEADWMIFTPETFEEVLRSGTWSTIRYAKKKNKDGFIVWPDGVVKPLKEWEQGRFK